MSVVAYRLVEHDYDEKMLISIFSVNELKSVGFEWNADSNHSHPINEEIATHDYAYSIQSIDIPRDEYGYCFIDETKLEEGNYLYTLGGYILDAHLPESIVKRFVSTVIEYLNQFHREKVEDTYRIDRVTGLGIQPLPLAPQFINNSVAVISSAVSRSFVASRDGIVPLTEEQEIRLKEIADKMNNAPE